MDHMGEASEDSIDVLTWTTLKLPSISTWRALEHLNTKFSTEGICARMSESVSGDP